MEITSTWLHLLHSQCNCLIVKQNLDQNVLFENYITEQNKKDTNHQKRPKTSMYLTGHFQTPRRKRQAAGVEVFLNSINRNKSNLHIRYYEYIFFVVMATDNIKRILF